jgi:transcriptional regulator GlxA family with amidase domain
MKRSERPGEPLRVALFAYPDLQALDLSGPLEMFARATRLLRDEKRTHPGYSLVVTGTRAGPITASSGFRFLPDITFGALRGRIDTLLVLGGRGVNALLEDRAVLAWLRRMAGRVRRLGSVCTGAFLLAEAGVLDGRSVSTHWSRAAELAQRYPRVCVEQDRIWVRDGNVYTSAGVSAGMDLALALIEEDLGAEVALAVARAMVVYLHVRAIRASTALRCGCRPRRRRRCASSSPGPPSTPRPTCRCRPSRAVSARARVT